MGHDVDRVSGVALAIEWRPILALLQFQTTITRLCVDASLDDKKRRRARVHRKGIEATLNVWAMPTIDSRDIARVA